MTSPREAMLRSEFQEWYPSVKAGTWYPAEELTALVREHLRDGSPHWAAEGRVPSDYHFAFRGGRARAAASRRTRYSDGFPAASDSPRAAPPLQP